MRVLVDSLIALMLAAILVGVLIQHREEQHKLERVQHVHQALTRLYDQAAYRVAVAEVMKTPTGFAAFISPLWFEDDLPVNVIVPGKQPWLDIAPDGDTNDHPPDPIITSGQQAGFWYNPTRGVFRARVTEQMSSQETLRLYNQLNNTAVTALPHKMDPKRAPRALEQVAAELTAKANAAPDAKPAGNDHGAPLNRVAPKRLGAAAK
jgi:hypothetical protein